MTTWYKRIPIPACKAEGFGRHQWTQERDHRAKVCAWCGKTVSQLRREGRRTRWPNPPATPESART